jgi:phospholipase/carboxylesterase
MVLAAMGRTGAACGRSGAGITDPRGSWGHSVRWRVRILSSLPGSVDRRLASRAAILADFIEGARTRYSLTRAPIAIGFSNGAVMAAALLLTRPRLLAGAVLFRPLSPFRDDVTSSLDDTPVLIIDGDKDARRSPGDGALLAERLTRSGAAVSHHVLPVGHSIIAMDREIARVWLATGGV